MFLSVRESFIRALALQPPDESPPPRSLGAAILIFHLCGILLVARLAHWPLLLIALALAAAIGLSVLPLTPLFFAYLVAALRILIALAARAQEGSRISSFPFVLFLQTGSLTVPPPWGELLNLNWTFALGAIWAVAIRLPAARRPQAATIGLAALAFGWAGYLYFHSAPAGVTGTDPYVYVQMAVDLAERGTPLHLFPLAATARELGLPVYPVLHVGYRVPDAPSILAPTVWPPGFSVLLAASYRLFGECGLYFLNPLLGLASLGATLWLAVVLFREHPHRWAIGAFAALWLATSLEQTARLLVPLADIAAQLFTTLALLFALRFTFYASRFTLHPPPSTFLTAFLAGLTFGLAYFVRYTQLLIAPAILYFALNGLRRSGEGTALTFGFWSLAFGFGSLVVALPDLWYHRLAFGSPFRTGSDELALFRLDAIPAMAALVARETFAPREFLWALPFVVFGLAVMWRRHRRELLGLSFGFCPLVLFHLLYPYLRLRDLLSLFPVLAIVGAFGAVEAIRSLMARGNALRIAVVALTIAAPLARWESAWPLARGFYTFGYLSQKQREAYGSLARLTPPGSVIAASLNSGAIELYSGRETIRPAAWTDDEFETFLSAVRSAGREVYLLDDGAELRHLVDRLRAAGRLRAAATLPGVYFQSVGGGSENLDLNLYRIEVIIGFQAEGKAKQSDGGFIRRPGRAGMRKM